MAVNIHITIIELNALHTKRQNLFQELDAVIHLLMEAKHWRLRKSRNATSLNSRFKILDTLFFNDITTTEIYTLSLHDALPICRCLTTVLPTSRSLTAQRTKPHVSSRFTIEHRSLPGARGRSRQCRPAPDGRCSRD